jgi:DNA-binding NarL/FixJ family response regulator
VAVRVVVVDDSIWMRRMVRNAADVYDEIEVVGEAADGAEAVSVCTALHPDVVLLDVEMPGIGGIEAIPLLKTAVPAARIAMFTSDTAAEEPARRAGADDYLVKSDVSIEELVSRLAGRVSAA